MPGQVKFIEYIKKTDNQMMVIANKNIIERRRMMEISLFTISKIFQGFIMRAMSIFPIFSKKLEYVIIFKILLTN